MALQQGGNSGDQLGQGGAQGNHGHAHHFGGDAGHGGQRNGRAFQHISAHGNQAGAEDQYHQVLQQRAVFAFVAVFFLRSGGHGVFKAVIDGAGHIGGKHYQHHDAQPAVKAAEDIGGHHIDGGRDEEEDNGGDNGLAVNAGGTDGNGQCGDQCGVADDRADGVAVSDSAVVVEGSGDGNHDFGQGGADGNHGGTDDDLGHLKALGNAHSAVDEPVAALDQQQNAHCKQQQRAAEAVGQAVVPGKELCNHIQNSLYI